MRIGYRAWLHSEPQSRSSHKATGKGEPEFGERNAQARKGQLHLTQMRSAAMTGVIDQPIASRPFLLAHEIHEKGVGEREHAEQLEPSFPVIHAQTLDRQFAFQIAERHLDLPAPRIGHHHAPGISGGFDDFVGQQIPGRATFAPADYQRQGPIGKVGMGHGKKEDAALDIAAMHGIKDGARSQTALPGNFPCRLLTPLASSK